MANFRSNFSALKLLSGEPILGYIDNVEFKIIPLKLLDYYNPDFAVLISILEKDINEIKNMIQGREIESYYILFSLILSGVSKTEKVELIANSVLRGLQMFIPDLIFENKKFIIKGRFLDELTFNKIILLLFEMIGKEKIIISPDDDEFEKRAKEMKLKAQRIKRNAKKKEGGKIEDMLISIVYTFPQYKMSDLFGLNIYTIYYLFGYVGKISNYEVEKIAYANGNFKKGKKLKYFIE